VRRIGLFDDKLLRVGKSNFAKPNIERCLMFRVLICGIDRSCSE